MLSTTGTSFSNNGGGSYSSDRPPTTSEGEITHDTSSSGFFHSDYKKHDDLKHMLDSNKDGLKLEAMKRIISMVAKGRDASELFPAVVKNVVSKNIEVKKLVYVYLVRYAEDQQDLALLSISTFQRALKDPNQLIRASALRVLSSIRVPMIVPIMMLAIRDSASDMSPYVRKTAAHAIPKLYSLDPDHKEELIKVLEKLLSDRTTLVVGSAVMAFEEVCPERTDLIHKNYRKLCNLLVDVDEWGQIIIVNMLTRYARTQFLNPNLEQDVVEEVEEPKSFYESDSEPSEEKKTKSVLDPDHKLLLRNTKPLLQSRNAAVVMAVSQLYYHAAPREESLTAAKALIRLLRSHREIQIVVLTNIASISINRKGMFESFLKSFFVRTSDATQIKLLKLDILTNLANESNVNTILRELQTYISSSDKEFVGATIQAVGRCASNISSVTELCLNGLVKLLSYKDEAIVAESVVVIKKLLQTQPDEHKDIIGRMATLMDFITVPQARASILWLLGEYSTRVPKIAPDVLRKMAKTFANEQDIVKLQTLNLAVKLYLTNPEQTAKFCEHVFLLAKYDQNYDIRDRARFLRFFIFKEEGEENKWHDFAKRIFLAHKPAPTLNSRFHNSEFQLGTLSHFLNERCKNYKTLPDFPEVQPDPTVRDVPDPTGSNQAAKSTPESKDKKSKDSGENFYEDVESTAEEESDEEEDSTGSDSEDEEDDEGEDEEEEGGEDEESGSEGSSVTNEVKVSDAIDFPTDFQTSSEENSQESGSEESGSEEEESDDEEIGAASIEYKSSKKAESKVSKTKAQKEEPKSNLDLLLDLDDVIPMTPIMTPSLGGFLTPMAPNSVSTSNDVKEVAASFIPIKKHELLNKVSGRGLELNYRFTRTQHLASSAFLNIELSFCNKSNDAMTNICVGKKTLPSGMSMHDFSPIVALQPNATLSCYLGINFNDSTQNAAFSVDYVINEEKISRDMGIKAPIGELMRSVVLPHAMFLAEKEKLKGMNEHSSKVSYSGTVKQLQQKILESANLNLVFIDDDDLRFAAHTLASKSLVLVTVKMLKDESNVEICVNCEKMVVGSMLLNEIKNILK